MRKSHLTMSWGFLAALVICLAFTCSPFASLSAQDAAQEGLVIKVRDLPFNEVVRQLATQSQMHLVMKVENATPITLNFPTPTPLEQILASATQAVGLDFWKASDGQTFIIGKRSVEVDPEPLRPQLPDNPKPPAQADPPHAPATLPSPVVTPPPPAADSASVIRTIYFKHASSREVCWMLGVPGYAIEDHMHRRVMRSRIETVVNPRNPVINSDGDQATSSYSGYGGYGGGASYTAPATVVNGSRNRGVNAADNGNQIFGPGPNQPNPPNQPNQPNQPPNQPNQPNQNQNGGGLAAFLPKGIDPANILGLIGLNALLVKATGKTQAEAEEAINQLEELIKLLDQPVKQVIVEVMFVKMEVKDAMSIGSSWEFAGMPVDVTSNNGGGEGNFGISYIKGNLKVKLATLITNTKAKVVNAPRVVVQNGGQAAIQLEDSIPFIIVDQQQDVFGRTFQTPQVQMQQFNQGLQVNEVTIHPDKSVTLNVTPMLEAPGAGIGIPGGGGQVLGGSNASIQTIVRVKDGETIMMGGFVSKNESMGGTRDPLLSSLPIVGPLFFRNNSHSTNNTETLVFVTPTIMEDDTTNFEGWAQLPPLF